MPSQHDPNKIPLGGHRLFPHEVDGIKKLVTLAGLKNRTALLQLLSRHPAAVAELLRRLAESEK